MAIKQSTLQDREVSKFVESPTRPTEPAVEVVDNGANDLLTSIDSKITQTIIVNAIESNAFDLNASAYSQTSAITEDYILDHVELNFSTSQSKNITITLANGTKLWESLADASLNIVIEDINIACNGGDNFTIAITQTAGACSIDVKASIKQGESPIGSSLVGTELDQSNSSTTALNNGQTFTGTWTDTLGFNTVTVAAKTDQNGLMYIEFSPDGSNADSSLPYTVVASSNEIHRLTCTRRYFRVRFTNNSGSNQTYLRLQSILGNHQLLTSPLNSSVSSDSDTILTRSIIYGETDGGTFRSVPVTQEGHLEVAIHGPRLPFGSVHTENLTPIFQSDAVYGLNSGQVEYSSSLSGAVSGANSTFKVSTGTTQYAQAQLQSRKRLRYRAGQGVVGRFAGFFSTPAANSYQVAGFGHAEDGLYFGYKDTDFGILYSRKGVREVQTLTINTASSTTENVTVTLNGVAFSVAVTNSANVNRTAYEISMGTFAGWKAYPQDGKVVFVADAVGNKAGSFSLSGTTASGTFAETKAGVAATETFIAQSDWNGDKLDGTGASGVTLDPTKGNVFQIGIQYLGFGSFVFSIETSLDGNNPDFVVCHTINLPNTLTATSLGNPSFPFTMAVYSAGSTTDLSVTVGSFAGFVEGSKTLHGNRFSYFNATTAGTASDYRALFTIQNPRYYAGRSNQVVINLLSVTGAVKHTQPVVFYLIKNGTLAGNPNFQSVSSISASLWDIAATTVTWSSGEQLLWTGHLGETGQIDHHFGNGSFNAEELTLQPGEFATLAVRSVQNNIAHATGAINTREDQ